MSAFPSREKCLSLLREEGCGDDVIEHCIAVERLAMGIARHCTTDVETLELVSRGALLHDIGRSRTHGIMHAVEGAALLRARGMDEPIIRIVERHIGAGLTSDESRELGLPVKDYIPLTLAEKIVAEADNLIGEMEHAAIRMPLSVAVEKARARGLNVLAERMTNLHEELSQMCGIDIDKIE
ncbi:MAG: HDIG domain-containing protein [Thermoplasmata archaeon]|nr:HDIG domain-containing protein [Thermoplasmata archaeon]